MIGKQPLYPMDTLNLRTQRNVPTGWKGRELNGVGSAYEGTIHFFLDKSIDTLPTIGLLMEK